MAFLSVLAPALATQFENSIWIHKRNLNQQQIFDYGTDVFVFEVVEKKLGELEDFRISFISSAIE